MIEITTLEQVPAAVSQALNRLIAIEKLLNGRSEPQPDADRWFNLEEFCAYHPDKPTKTTAYGWTSELKVPFHKDGKKLRFLKSEIDAWLMQGRKKTFADVSADADTYINKKGLNNG